MAKVYIDQLGDRLVVEAGGNINLKAGATISVDGAQGAAMTAQKTTITHTAPGTPDFAIQDLTNSSGFGFVTKDEGNSVLQCVANLQVRVLELEARLKTLTFLPT